MCSNGVRDAGCVVLHPVIMWTSAWSSIRVEYTATGDPQLSLYILHVISAPLVGESLEVIVSEYEYIDPFAPKTNFVYTHTMNLLIGCCAYLHVQVFW